MKQRPYTLIVACGKCEECSEGLRCRELPPTEVDEDDIDLRVAQDVYACTILDALQKIDPRVLRDAALEWTHTGDGRYEPDEFGPGNAYDNVRYAALAILQGLDYNPDMPERPAHREVEIYQG